MFRAIISPILTSTRLCLQLVVKYIGDAASRQHRRCITPQPSAHEDGRNYRPKHVEPIVIINKICYCCIQLAVYIIVSVTQGHTNIRLKSVQQATNVIRPGIY